MKQTKKKQLIQTCTNSIKNKSSKKSDSNNNDDGGGGGVISESQSNNNNHSVVKHLEIRFKQKIKKNFKV
ncbi:hypothetical protein DERF_007993 [Dermatophagoides farinae]|uniref:Uncharacterized protein n=1 Tax=Dermatophagoides farinae TaxID=6954 RepID=A0A922L518_DERFA|nr:hypothetical protein DERF_007993 [Dermatophagoides farinae]